MRSQAQVVTFWVQAAAGGRVTHQAATVGIEDAEGDAQATSVQFASWDPPPDLGGGRTEVTDTGGDLVTVFAAVRIAARQSARPAGEPAGRSGNLDPGERPVKPSKLFAFTLGTLSAIGGFIDIGDLVVRLHVPLRELPQVYPSVPQSRPVRED